MTPHARPAVTAEIIPLPLARRRLAEASIVPIAGAVSAIVFDTPPNGARSAARLTALLAGEALRGASLSTSLELRSGGRRHLLVVGRSAGSLTGLTITLALGAELAAIVDGDWLQPPIASGAALVRGLSEAGRQRLLKLFLTTGASLFGRGAPEFADAAKRLVELVGAPAAEPASWCRIGAAGRLVSYRLPAGLDADGIDTLIAIAPSRVARLSGWQLATEPSERGVILHAFIPGALQPGTTLVGLGPAHLHLLAPDDDLPPRLLVPWLARRSAPTRSWVQSLLHAAEADPTAAALSRELTQGADAAPKATIRHLSATCGGLLFALDLADPCALVRAVRIERGHDAEEIPPSARLSGFATLPGHDDCRISLLYHSGRIVPVHAGAPAAFSGDVPTGCDPSAVARARLDMERRAPQAIETFGTPNPQPPLTIVAGVGDSLDIIRARAALLFAEPRGHAVEIVYHALSGPLADAARVAIAHAEAVTGIAHRLVTLPAGATAADRLIAALSAAAAPRILSLGADVLPSGPGWLAPWLSGLTEARPILGGALLDVAGSVLDAGGTIAPDKGQPTARPRATGCPARDLPRTTAATTLVTAECVGLTRSAADLLCTGVPNYPNPDLMLAELAQRMQARTLFQCRFVRYAAPAPRTPHDDAVDAAALALLLKAFFRICRRSREAMSAMRILQVAHDHPDWTPGGTEILAHDLARALDTRAGVSARFLAASTSLQDPSATPGALRAHGEDFVLQTGAYDRFSMTRLDGTGWIASLGRVLDRVRPDIVHLHGLDRIGAEVLPVIRRLAPRSRIVLTLHDYQLICANDGLLLTTGEAARCKGARPDRCRRCFPDQSAARHALRQAHLLALLQTVDVFVAPSAFLRDRFTDWGIAPHRIRLLPNATAPLPALPDAGARSRRDRFGFFGTIARHKGALVLLDAAARLKDAGADLRVTLHGGLGWADDGFRAAFDAKLRAAEPLARHAGPYDRADVAALMRSVDWVVVPSTWWENAPLVIHEAHAAGRPVICSGIGGMAELVEDGVTGLHVPPGDPAALAETMSRSRRQPCGLGPPVPRRGPRQPRRLRRGPPRPLPCPPRPGGRMTPADGAEFPHEATELRSFRDTCAILLHGGRVLLTFVSAERPPAAGHLVQSGSLSRWVAECWQPDGAERWYGVAVLDALPTPDAEVRSSTLPARWRFTATPRLDVSPDPLADHVRKAGASGREVFGFLVRHLLAHCTTDSPEAQSHRAFARSFLAAVASHDGFIEIVGAPDTGGYLAQGWSMSLQPGTTILADATEDLALREVEVAVFDRDDILPPGQGFCLFGKFWSDAGPGGPGTVFFERDGQLLRLDVVRDSVLRLTADGAREHVARMLPRLRAPDATLQAFRRVCRPRFAGADTLSPTTLPIAAACDAVLQAPDGTLLVLGWLLDPLQRVERVLVKSTGHLYCQLDTIWCALPRPDLTAGFAQDPRLAGLLDERDVMHGFIAHAPAARGEIDGAQLYLELVLDDGSCLFRPLTVTPFATGERLPQLLRTLSPAEPELQRIIDAHLAPFLASVRPMSSLRRRGAAIRALPLGAGTGARAVSAIMPFRTLAELQPILALLAGTPEAEIAGTRPRHRTCHRRRGAGQASARPSPSTASPAASSSPAAPRRCPPSSTSASRPPPATSSSPGRPPRCPKPPAGSPVSSPRRPPCPLPASSPPPSPTRTARSTSAAPPASPASGSPAAPPAPSPPAPPKSR